VFELEPASAAGFQLRGWIHYSRARIQEAVRDLKLALELEPNDPDTLLLLSNCYLISGRVSAARPLLDRLISIDPLTPLTRCMPAFASLLDGDVAGAIGPYREMFEMDPGNPMARLFYVWVLLLNRRIDTAVPILESFPVEVRDTVPDHLYNHVRIGKIERSKLIGAAGVDACRIIVDACPVEPWRGRGDQPLAFGGAGETRHSVDDRGR